MSLVHLRLLTWSPYQREGWEQNQPEPVKISDPPSSYDVPDCTVMKKVTIFALLNLPVIALDLPEKVMIFRLSSNLESEIFLLLQTILICRSSEPIRWYSDSLFFSAYLTKSEAIPFVWH